MQQVVYILLSFTDMLTQDVQASEGHMDERNTEIQAPTVLSTDSAQHVQIVEEDDTVDNVVDWHNNCMVQQFFSCSAVLWYITAAVGLSRLEQVG